MKEGLIMFKSRILICTSLVSILSLVHLGFSLDNQSNSPTDHHNNATIESHQNDLEFLKKLFYERRKKHLGAARNIKNVEVYEQRYKMISVIIDEMVAIIETKKVIIDRVNDELKNNLTTSLSDGNIKDALLSICENTALFGDIVLENPDITHRMMKKKKSWYETFKWSLTFVKENPLLLDRSTVKMLGLVFQELNLTERTPDYTNPNWSKISDKSEWSNDGIDKHKKEKKDKRPKRKNGPQIVHVDL